MLLTKGPQKGAWPRALFGEMSPLSIWEAPPPRHQHWCLGTCVSVHLHADNISSVLSISEHNRDVWSRPWEILSDKSNHTWHKAMHHSHAISLGLCQVLIWWRSHWTQIVGAACKNHRKPHGASGKKKIKQKHRKGKKMGRQRKVTSIPSLLSHNQYYYPFPVGIPNNSLFPIRIFSLYLFSSS